jgi:hypothetical protein
MATPVSARPTSNRYLGNSDPDHMEVHDLNNEQPQCQIDEIIAAGNAVIFSPDTLDQARRLVLRLSAEDVTRVERVTSQPRAVEGEG